VNKQLLLHQLMICQQRCSRQSILQLQISASCSTLMINFIAGVKSQDENSRITFTNIISGCLTAIKNKYYEFQSVGQECMAQFISGINLRIR
jgi:hypothetical protein